MLHNLSTRPIAAMVLGLLLLVASATPRGQSQAPSPTAAAIPPRWTPGFAAALAGDVISYPSAYPGQLRTLLTRATDGRMRIEWEAQPAPSGLADELVHFIWHAGLASGYGAHRFTLSINGTPCATFTSGRDVKDRDWSVPTSCDGTLSFRTIKVGNFNELFGLMTLSIPRRLVSAGKPRFAAVGEAAGSQDYYLVFEQPLADFARVMAEEAVLKGGRRALRVEISRIANEQPARVLSGGSVLWSGTLAPGYTSLFVPAPARASSQLPVTIEIAGQAVSSTTIALKPVRRWAIHLLPHSHVDIGYSDPQPEVERKQWKNLREAVELARKTASYPAGARFRWNVEGLWSVESYLRQAPEAERRAFVDAVKRGWIGLQANYTNILTGLASPEELVHWTDAARQLRATYGFPQLRSAMHTDIPGLSWSSVQPLVEGGVRYFSSGPNYMPSLPDGGDRIGATLRALGDKPFWWVSPSGSERILFWVAGRGYSWFHGMNMGSITKAGRTPILDYVRELNDAGYAWNMVQARYTVGGDNGPVDPELPDAVKAWNEMFDSPRLVIDTAESMFAEFERRYGAKLPKLAGDMTPYWEDGAISSAGEEARVLASARTLTQAETLWCLRDATSVPTADVSEAWRNVLLWHEHTWGAADSISQPDRADVVAQWNYKRQFALEAAKRSQALMAGATKLQSIPTSRPATVPTTSGPSSKRDTPAATNGGAAPRVGPVLIEVANTLSWPRTGLVLLAADLTAGRDRVTDAKGRSVVSQRLADGRLAVLAVSVPPLGSTRLTVNVGASAAPHVPVKSTGESLDNGVVRVVVDRATGTIRSLRAAAAHNDELVATNSAGGAGLNAYLYVPGRDPSLAQRAAAARVTLEEAGPLVATLRIESDQVPGGKSLTRRVTLVAGEQALRIENVLDKTAVRAKESAHIAFPFDLSNAAVRVDEGNGVVGIERDQLAGSCRDFIGVHSAIDFTADNAGVSLASLDAPLLELGAMTDERQDPDARVRSWRTKTVPGSAVYAYLLNNYWHTNYKAEQEGELTYRFVVRPHAGGEDSIALRRFGAEQEQPLIAYPVSAGTPAARAPFRMEGAAIAVSSIRAGEAGSMLVRLYNASSRPATARMSAVGRRSRLRAVLVTAQPAPVPTQTRGRSRRTPAARGSLTSKAGLTLPPFGTVVVRVSDR